MSNETSESGFSAHVWGQLEQTAAQSSVQNRAPRGRGRGRGRAQAPQQYHHQPQSSTAQGWDQPHQPSADTNAYPPLGTNRPQTMSQHSYSSTSGLPNQSFNTPSYGRGQGRSNDARNYFEQARNGAQRGGFQRHRGHAQGPAQQISAPGTVRQQTYHTNQRGGEFSRPAPTHNRNLYHYAMNPTYGTYEQQQAMRHKIMMQADQLERVARPALQKGISIEEQKRKERFRKSLERLVQAALSESNLQTIDPTQVELKAYGGSVNGFALAGCDMDLLLSLPDSDTQSDDRRADVAKTVGRLIGAALLKTGYGARLLTHTRVPILKICESPSAELLQNLRQRWVHLEAELDAEMVSGISNDQPPVLADDDLRATMQTLKELNMDDTPAKTQLPDSPPLANAKLEFTGDCGIECDITFVRKIALVNSHLLKTYSFCDERVRKLGIFVKSWAKARGINEPYYGTLSSYGYVLMVLHYCMNVVSPPLVPNLQVLAKSSDEWNNSGPAIPEHEFDTRFVSDANRINDYMQAANPQKNRDSLGKLIAGFFLYYTSQSGFHWTRDIISIRTWGGVLSKQQKGWTSASQREGHRNRYLLAIEDPFELDHNVGRVVGHHGIVAIRDELRRAQKLIDSVGTDIEMERLENLLDVVEARRDTHREDAQHHKERLRRLRQMHEAKENAALHDHEADVPNGGVAETEEQTSRQPTAEQDTDGTWNNPDGAFQNKPKSAHKRLTHAKASKDPSKRSFDRRIRKCKSIESDNEESDNAAVEDVLITEIANKTSEDRDAHQDSKMSENQNDFNEASSSYYADVQTERSKVLVEDTVILDNEPRVDASKMSDSEKEQSGFATTSDEESVLRNHGFDPWGNLKAWNVQSREGSFLARRDSWIIGGTYLVPKHPYFAALDRACPYDPARPPPNGSCPYNPLHEQKPKWPTSGHGDGTTPAGEKLIQVGRKIVRVPIQKSVNAREAKSVGYNIPWDIGTKAGRWLRRRDKATRENKNWRVSKDRRQLDIDFPYNPDMTLGELEEKNSELRLHYWNSYCWVDTKTGNPPLMAITHEEDAMDGQEHSQPPHDAVAPEITSDPTAQQEANEGEIDCHSGVVADTSAAGIDFAQAARIGRLPSVSPRPDSSRVQHIEPNNNDVEASTPTSAIQTSKTLPDLAFVRQQRLAFYNKKSELVPETVQDAAEADQPRSHGRNVIDLMKSVGIDKQNTVEARDDLKVIETTTSKPDHHDQAETLTDEHVVEGPASSIHSMPDEVIAQHVTTPVEVLASSTHSMPDEAIPQDMVTPFDESIPGLIRDVSTSPSDKEVRVPDTLLPHMDSDHRPRDEDPRIMPIPHTLGFQFDPRQLRDLSVIKEGGNGCARDGQEYNIEDEFEWGGGGDMAYRSDTAKFTGYEFSIDEGEWVPGTGDEDGLLDELPGL